MVSNSMQNLDNMIIFLRVKHKNAKKCRHDAKWKSIALRFDLINLKLWSRLLTIPLLNKLLFSLREPQGALLCQDGVTCKSTTGKHELMIFNLQFHHQVHIGLAFVRLKQLYYVRVIQPIKYKMKKQKRKSARLNQLTAKFNRAAAWTD